jgi:hypothetical protein
MARMLWQADGKNQADDEDSAKVKGSSSETRPCPPGIPEQQYACGRRLDWDASLIAGMRRED